MRGAFDERRMQALAACLEPDEPVLARGRAFEPIHPEGQDLSSVISGPGSAVIVTERRILWAGNDERRWVRALPFDLVTSYTEVFQAHRYALAIDHEAIEVLQHVPRHRFLGWAWGNAVATVRLTETTLAFSRQTTEVAQTIKRRLDSLGVPALPPRTMPKRRDDEASHYLRVLRSDDR